MTEPIIKYSSYTDSQKRATKKYRDNNKEKVNEQRKKYYYERKAKDPAFMELKRAKAKEYYKNKKASSEMSISSNSSSEMSVSDSSISSSCLSPSVSSSSSSKSSRSESSLSSNASDSSNASSLASSATSNSSLGSLSLSSISDVPLNEDLTASEDESKVKPKRTYKPSAKKAKVENPKDDSDKDDITLGSTDTWSTTQSSTASDRYFIAPETPKPEKRKRHKK